MWVVVVLNIQFLSVILSSFVEMIDLVLLFLRVSCINFNMFFGFRWGRED